MIKTNLLLSDITNIIDLHLESEEYNLLFVCNKNLAKYICDYVYKEYGIIDEDMELKDSIKEYYVSLYFSNNKVSFYCETAKGYSGEYKLNDIDNEKINFYICVNMDKKTIFDRLINYNENAKFTCVDVIYENIENPYEYNNEDEVCECDECKYKDEKKYESCNDDCKYINCDECCNDFCDCENEDNIIEDEICIQDKECQGCNECIDCDEVECENQISSEKLEELKLIAHFTDEVLKREGCPECTFELLADLYIKGKNIGWENHKEFMRELMGEALEE